MGDSKVSEETDRIIDLNESNIDDYGLLCRKSKKKGEGYQKKLKWVRERFREGLRIKILLVNEGGKRGFTSRGFIEYIPGEYAWRGISAEGYMVIHCIWVVGKNKNKGYGTRLLEECIQDARGMKGVAVVTSNGGWLPRRNLFIKNGFTKVDSIRPDFELYVKRFSDDAVLPKFSPLSKERLESLGPGLTVLESDQCPYSSNLVKLCVKIAEKGGTPARIWHISTAKEAQNSGIHSYGSFCIVLNNKVISYRPGDPKAVMEALRQD